MSRTSAKEQVFQFTDACYALDSDDQEWLTQLAERARPFLDYGLGVATWAFRKDDWTGTRLPSGVDATLGEAMWRAATCYTRDELCQLFLGGRASSATERLNIEHGLDEHHAGRHFGPIGIKDFHALTVFDGAGRGVALTGAAEQVLRPKRHQLARLERLGAHVLAGYRLRRELHQIDAVLEPDGRSVHAEREAREPAHQSALVRAVRAFDHARSRLGPANADEALLAFEGLVVGRWSIVQNFESDGRRYLVAIKNQPGQMAAAALTANESHALLLRAQGLAHKIIAYELGLTEVMSCGLVQDGMRKLGVGRESDLPLLFRAQADAALAEGSAGD